jgi:hypothetical protein
LGITIIIAVLISAAIYYFWQQGRRGKVSTIALRKEARRLLHSNADSADEIIDRQIQLLQQKHPGRSEKWYLEKIIYDLERDR